MLQITFLNIIYIIHQVKKKQQHFSRNILAKSDAYSNSKSGEQRGLCGSCLNG